jgi:excinuclease ABC subunit C
VSVAFAFEHRVEFVAEDAEEILRLVPAAPGVFALRGGDAAAEPYLTRGADLRRRMRRLLAPPEAVDEQGRPVLSKRLNLREKVRWIEWTRTGSEFESQLVLYCAAREAFGAEQARRRLRLYAPYFLRVTMGHEHPRMYSTNRLSARSMAESFGPFPSRAAAERYGDAVLDLFQLRRCYEDLEPHPDHAGCAYGEMKKCMAPCKQACTPEDYAVEAHRVRAFLATRGQSMLDEVAVQREAASEAMDFESAAALHKQWEKVKAASLLADELVRPVAALRAVVLQESAPREDGRTEEAAVFLLERGRMVGPGRLSTLGVRAVREQTAVGSSLFAQPLMLAAVPLEETAEAASAGGNSEASTSPDQAMGPADSLGGQGALTLSPEDRARGLLVKLATEADDGGDPETAELCDALSLFRRWYYRPEKQRAGEVFLPNPDGRWPVRRILNGAARVVLGPPAAAPAVDREGAKVLKTKIIHAGREGVEREVAVLPKRSRTRKAVTPADVTRE